MSVPITEIRIQPDSDLAKKIVEQTQQDIDARVQDLKSLDEHRRLTREAAAASHAEWKAHAASIEECNRTLAQNHKANLEINRGILDALNEIVALLRGKAGTP